ALDESLGTLADLREAMDVLQIAANEAASSLAERDEELRMITTELESAREIAATKTSQLELGKSQFEELQSGFQKQRIILMLRQSKFERAANENENLKANVAELTAQIDTQKLELEAALAELEALLTKEDQ
ncbi:MAG: hypothetical protein P8Q23_03045, partial [Paracoccaceae bacterium]|nr:hypothetical protein [Paracoccaceae bacterium]